MSFKKTVIHLGVALILLPICACSSFSKPKENPFSLEVPRGLNSLYLSSGGSLRTLFFRCSIYSLDTKSQENWLSQSLVKEENCLASGAGSGEASWISVFPSSWLSSGSALKIREDLHSVFPVSPSALKVIERSKGDISFDDRVWIDSAGEYIEHDFNDGLSMSPSGGMIIPYEAKGQFARSVLYVSLAYLIPLPKDIMVVLNLWNAQFPPSLSERGRERLIFKLQDRRNPFIYAYGKTK